jgi:hypothetical protein
LSIGRISCGNDASGQYQSDIGQPMECFRRTAPIDSKSF